MIEGSTTPPVLNKVGVTTSFLVVSIGNDDVDNDNDDDGGDDVGDDDDDVGEGDDDDDVRGLYLVMRSNTISLTRVSGGKL